MSTNSLKQPSLWLDRIVQVLTGAHIGERARTVFSFLALFFLLNSYYLVKPLRDSYFLKEFDPAWLPHFFLIVPFISYLVTKLFNSFYGIVPKYRLVIFAFLIIMSCKLFFYLTLDADFGPNAEIIYRALVIIFWLWTAIYFLLSLSVLWACINDIFSPKEGSRCFGFIAVGSTIGSLGGSWLSTLIASSPFKHQPLFFSALLMGMALLCILAASRYRHPKETQNDTQKQAPAKRDFLADLQQILQEPYVRSIAIIVFSLACFNTVMEFQIKKMIDRELSEEQYLLTFHDLNQKLNFQGNFAPEEINQVGYSLVYSLKSQNADLREAIFQRFLTDNKVSCLNPMALYKDFRKELEIRIRAFMSKTYMWQNILGVFFLMVCSRFLFIKVGLRYAALILPAFCLLATFLFAFPLEILLIQTLMVLGGSLSYSLNNASKELMYTVTSEQAKFQLKPMIEGPIMRFADFLIAILNILFASLISPLLGLSEFATLLIFLGLIACLILYWLRSAWFAGKTYDTARSS